MPYSRSDILNQNTSDFPNNNSGQITPAILRDFNANFVNSVQFIGDPTDSASYAATASIATSASYANNATLAATASFFSGSIASASYAATASIATSASYANNATSASYSNNSTSASYAVNASNAISSSTAVSSSYANNATSASYANNATSASYANNSTSASFATTASFALNVPSLNTGSFATTGSNIFTGQNVFNDSLVIGNASSGEQLTFTTQNDGNGDNGHFNLYQGPLNNNNQSSQWEAAPQGNGQLVISALGPITGPGYGINLNGSTFVTGSLNVSAGITGSLEGTASYATQALSASYALTASFALNAGGGSTDTGSLVTTASFNAYTSSTNTFTGSIQTQVNALQSATSSYVTNAQTSSMSVLSASFASTIASGLNITASNILVTNNLNVNGTASFAYLKTVTGSAVIVGDAFIILNADTPTLPFAGIKVYDTGSASTASFEWNGNGDYWIGVEESGQSAGFLTGTSGSKGSEVFPSSNRLTKGSGNNEIKDSNITDNGSSVSINSNTTITGSLNVSAGITGSLLGTASFADNSTSASYALNATSASFAPSSPAFPFSGSAEITGSLVVTGSITATGVTTGRTGSLVLNQQGGLNLITSIISGTNKNMQQYVTESYQSGINGGANIYLGTTANTSTGSLIVSGSGNYISVTSLLGNSTANNGGRSGFSGTRNFIFVVPTVATGSIMTLPTINNSWLAATLTLTNNNPNTGSVPTITNSFINSNVAGNNTSGSFTITNSNINATTTVTNTWSGSTIAFTNSILLGTSHIIRTFTTGSDSAKSLFGAFSSIIAGQTVNTLIKSGSVGGGILNSIIVTNSTDITGSASTTGSGALFGSWPSNDGRLNDLDHIRLAIGTGTGTSARRTSLYVSSSGDTVIQNNLLVTGSATFSGSLVLVGNETITGSLKISPSAFGATNYPYAITESLGSTNGAEGNFIIAGKNATETQSGSVIISGSTNIFIPSLGAPNFNIANGSGAGFNSRSSIITVASITVTGSNGSGYDRQYPSFLNSVVNGVMAITDNRPTITGSAVLSTSGAGFNGALNLTTSSGSLSISNSNIVGSATINITGSNGAAKTISNSFIGSSTTNIDSTSGTVLTTSVINGNSVNLLLSGSDNFQLQGALIIGNTLSVTGSTSTPANNGSAYVGRFNDTGATALVANTAFAVGAGSSAAARKTALHVSSSGLVTLTDGLIVTGSITATSVTSSLLGTASYADNATSASYSLVATSASYATNSTSASYAVTASFALNGGGGAAFPYTGSAVISGSLGVTGSVRGNIVTITAVSQTASLNLNLGNAFVFNAVSSSASASLLTLTNIPTGSNQKFSLLISQSVAGGQNVFFDSTFQFPSASQYTVSTTTGSADLLTFETYTY